MVLSAVLFLACYVAAQPGPIDYFEGTRWYEIRPGNASPNDFRGSLVVNRREEKIVFFSRHSKLVDVSFDDVISLAYEFAPRPRDLHLPINGKSRLYNKSDKHLLLLTFRSPQPATARTAGGTSESEDFRIVTTVFELPPVSFGEVLIVLENATGRTIKRYK